MEHVRRWTLQEANDFLPELIPILHRIRDAYAILAGHQEKVRTIAHRNGGDRDAPAWLRAAETLAADLRSLSAQGIVLRDAERGLVDFYAEREGRPVFLCWQLGEPRVAWWHPLDTGFAGRRPL